MFRGVNTISLDAKGRMAMPARQRERLLACCDGKLVATIDPQSRCLLLYPLPAWEEIEQEIQELPSLNSEVRRFQRLLIGHACDLEFDASNRVLLPPALREHAQLDKRVVLVGQVNKLELWDEDNWVAERESWLQQSVQEAALPDEMRRINL